MRKRPKQNNENSTGWKLTDFVKSDQLAIISGDPGKTKTELVNEMKRGVLNAEQNHTTNVAAGSRF